MDGSEWTGPVGDVWAAEWRRTDRALADLARALDAAIRTYSPAGQIAVADIGCGAGATTIALATARPDARVTGIDISAALIAIARVRAATLPNAAFVEGRIEQALDPGARFDLIVSRHGVMFFDDPVAGMAAIRGMARPGARLVFSCFRDPTLNAWANDLVAAVGGVPATPTPGYTPGPFAFADEAFVRATLDAAGWQNVTCEAVDFAYRAGAGDDPVADAVSLLSLIGPAARVLKRAEAGERTAMLDRLAAVCARYANGDTVDFPAAAWLWSAQNGSTGERL